MKAKMELPPSLERERQRALAFELARQVGEVEARALGARACAEALREVGDVDAALYGGRAAALEAVRARLGDVLGVLTVSPERSLSARVLDLVEGGPRAAAAPTVRPLVAGLSAQDPEARYASCGALRRTIAPWVEAESMIRELAVLEVALRAELPGVADCDAALVQASETVGELGNARAAIAAAREHLQRAQDNPDAIAQAIAALRDAAYPGGRAQALVESTLRHLERLRADRSSG